MTLGLRPREAFALLLGLSKLLRGCGLSDDEAMDDRLLLLAMLAADFHLMIDLGPAWTGASGLLVDSGIAGSGGGDGGRGLDLWVFERRVEGYGDSWSKCKRSKLAAALAACM